MSSGVNGVGPFGVNVTGRGFQRIDLTAGAVSGLTTPAGIAGPFIIAIEAQGGALRYRDDGTNPTTTIGFRVANGGVLVIQPSDASTIKLIRDGTDATYANVIYHTYTTAGEA